VRAGFVGLFVIFSFSGETKTRRQNQGNKRRNRMYLYEIRPRGDKRGVDLISDALPFGGVWYAGANAVGNVMLGNLIGRMRREPICSFEQVMRASRLQDVLERLTAAIRDVESELAAMKAEHDPLALHIFVSRRHYRNVKDTKSGKRHEVIARLSFNTACELGFRGSLDEWERLMGAVARR
jgi:hypothetical protein